MNLCIIPARGGSKRIPRKNIRMFRGRPIIAWSIQAAFDSGCFDRIVVSTDDAEISDIAVCYGAEVPFLRPKSLSDDYVGTKEVVRHAVNELLPSNCESSIICCLYATAPFVCPSDIVKAIELANNTSQGSVVFTATSFPFPIQRSIRITKEGYCSPFDALSTAKRSQDLEEFFHDAGQLYCATEQTWRADISIFDGGRPVVIPRWRVHDIDTEEDWKRAELIHSSLFKL